MDGGSERAPVTAPRNTGTDAGAPLAPGAMYRLLTGQGFRSAEASNLTAYLHGLAPVLGGWSINEIERLLFVRHLLLHGHIHL
jgi:hypothetical protein